MGYEWGFQKYLLQLFNTKTKPTTMSNPNPTQNTPESQEPRPTIVAAQLTRGESPSEKSWREHALKMQQSAPEHFESAAKFLSGLVSICLTLFLKINENAFAATDMKAWLGTAVVVWLISVLFSFFVFFPFTYPYSQHSAQTVEAANRKIVRTKKFCLMVATVAFVMGLVILGGVFLKGL
ncbi:MAG: hypothetical protein R3E32_07550 [Chitinophagales bacterium]